MLAASLPRLSLGMLLFVVCNGWHPLAAQDVPTEDVALQPLMSNVQRLLQTLDALGHPLEQATEQAISAATKARDASELQQAVDRAVLAVVTLSPEQRVSVARGPAAAELQQAGYVPMLLKIINHSTSTPVYASAAHKRVRFTPVSLSSPCSDSNKRSCPRIKTPPLTRSILGSGNLRFFADDG
ncbi:MAG: hypothetical protein R3C56_26090 [Pirellulaceae bacterium]